MLKNGDFFKISLSSAATHARHYQIDQSQMPRSAWVFVLVWIRQAACIKSLRCGTCGGEGCQDGTGEFHRDPYKALQKRHLEQGEQQHAAELYYDAARRLPEMSRIFIMPNVKGRGGSGFVLKRLFSWQATSQGNGRA